MAKESDSRRIEAEDPTLLASEITSPQPSHSTEPDAKRDGSELDPGDRYLRSHLLGRGGMGEVHSCGDRVIGRDVALKTIHAERGDDEGVRSRFVAEACVQARLQHPGIVPVYDLGVLPDGRSFFTMQRIDGVTLADVVLGLRNAEGDMLARYGLARRLSIFVQVCQAIDYAHTRGVIHRDLKPSNVMLGVHGEVYVLDWGLAQAEAVEDRRPGVEDARPGKLAAVAGTPGYMAPEQFGVHGVEVGFPADVYALGAILFELLTFERLHDQSATTERIASTLAGADARIRVRAPALNVAPELEAVCVESTQAEPKQRPGSAAAILEPVERYLAGDRDLALRRELAEQHAALAAVAVPAALRGDSLETHREALAEVSRALALDPEHTEARRLLVVLLTSPPAALAPETADQLDEERNAAERTFHRGGAVAFVAWLVLIPVFEAMGVRDRTALLVMAVLVALGVAVSVAGARAQLPRRRYTPLSLLITTLAMCILGRMFGPLILVPGLAAANAASFSMLGQGWRRVVYTALPTLAVVVPVGLELVGVLDPSYGFSEGAVVIHPHLVDLPQAATLFVLSVSSVVAVVLPALLLGRSHDSLEAARQRQARQAWQLQQLLPATELGVETGSAGAKQRSR